MSETVQNASAIPSLCRYVKAYEGWWAELRSLHEKIRNFRIFY